MLESRSLGGVRALVVDDEPDTRELVAEVLARHGADVVLAHDGAAALDACTAHTFDVIVSDLSMPTLEGSALLATLRSHGVRTPALALSANTSLDDVRKALSAGFQAHLPKPIGSDDLIEAVLCVLEQPIAA